MIRTAKVVRRSDGIKKLEMNFYLTQKSNCSSTRNTSIRVYEYEGIWFRCRAVLPLLKTFAKSQLRVDCKFFVFIFTPIKQSFVGTIRGQSC
jgi:hypothetical protein